MQYWVCLRTHLQNLRQVTMTERYNRRYASGMQLLQQPAVKLNACGVWLCPTATTGQDARP